uniref:hypothetical protein n=1 Tax=Nocardioides sp. TaxID=35761 RepID=UPI0035680491
AKFCKAKANQGKGKQPRRMRLAFNGTSLTIDYAVAKNGGKAKVFIDGERVGKLKFGGPRKTAVFGGSKTFTGLAKGNHSVKIVVTTGVAYIDTFSY